MSVVSLFIAALLTSTLSAMAGLGGGAILIGLMFAGGMPPALALPLHAGVQFASNASRGMAYGAHIHWPALGVFMVMALPGPFLVAPWVVHANPDWIRLIMAVFILLSCWPTWAAKLRLHGSGGLLAAGAIVGMTAPVVGATGVLMAPFFLRDDWRKEQIIATMAVAQVCVHALKIVAFSANGFNVIERLDLLLPMMIAAIVGTLIGWRLLGLFSEARFRQFCRALLIVLACKLGWDGVSGLTG